MADRFGLLSGIFCMEVTMTQTGIDERQRSVWRQFGIIIIAALVLVAIMLRPVKTWLNSIPFLWIVLYPLLSIFSLYVFIRIIQGNEGIVAIIKWAILLLSAVAMTLAVLNLGAVFYTIGKVAAVLFIILELGTLLIDAIR
jgi:hypothetical protein